MTRTLTLALTLATAFPFAASAQDSKAKPTASGAPVDLSGGYTSVSGDKYGEKEPAERVEGTTVIIAEDGIVVRDKDKKEIYAQTYKIDTATTPWTIVLKSKITPYTEKGAGESIAKGLIQKDGDTVKLIYALPGGEMPVEFKTKDKQLMFVMKNEKK